MRSFETKKYWISVDNLSQTFIIIDKRKDTTTFRFTGSEGLDMYSLLRGLYKESRSTLDAYVSKTQTFHTE